MKNITINDKSETRSNTGAFDYQRIITIGNSLIESTKVNCAKEKELIHKEISKHFNRYSTSFFIAEEVLDDTYYKVELSKEDLDYWYKFEREIEVNFKIGADGVSQSGLFSGSGGTIIIGESIFARIDRKEWIPILIDCAKNLWLVQCGYLR